MTEKPVAERHCPAGMLDASEFAAHMLEGPRMTF